MTNIEMKRRRRRRRRRRWTETESYEWAWMNELWTNKRGKSNIKISTRSRSGPSSLLWLKLYIFACGETKCAIVCSNVSSYAIRYITTCSRRTTLCIKQIYSHVIYTLRSDSSYVIPSHRCSSPSFFSSGFHIINNIICAENVFCLVINWPTPGQMALEKIYWLHSGELHRHAECVNIFAIVLLKRSTNRFSLRDLHSNARQPSPSLHAVQFIQNFDLIPFDVRVLWTEKECKRQRNLKKTNRCGVDESESEQYIPRLSLDVFRVC